jgi:hypothetical protein
MPGHNHYPNCTCGWCRGGGGWGGGHARASFVSLPAAGTRTAWDGDGCCCPTTCPMCGASVYFVRHNGGSVWFDSLGKPWPKHSCFFDDGYGLRLRTRLAQPSEGTTASRFGVVTETVVTGSRLNFLGRMTRRTESPTSRSMSGRATRYQTRGCGLQNATVAATSSNCQVLCRHLFSATQNDSRCWRGRTSCRITRT